MARKYKLVISDQHLGSGHRPGRVNPHESFEHDDKLVEFLRHYSTDYYEDEEVELIIAGDFYDFLAVRTSRGFTTQITEELALEKLAACVAGHREVHEALGAFVRAPVKTLTVLVGNHDMELVFPGVQAAFRRYLTGEPADPRIRFITDRPGYEFDGIQVHHGQQFEAMHLFNFRELTLQRGRQKAPILNLPWGSQFILRVLVPLKSERPYVDKVRPFKAYLMRALIFDTWFFWKVCWLSVWNFIETRFANIRHLRARMRQTWVLIREANIYPDLLHKVRNILDKNPDVHTLILGHTHVPQVRAVEGGRLYVNTGCWTDTVSLDLGTFGQRAAPTFALISYGEEPDERPTVKLLEWHGYHDLFREVRR
jgi:UDP-2,3-diacylglucosamine pyrophosphatase LpxH